MSTDDGVYPESSTVQDTTAVIGLAMSSLMTRRLLTADQAFETLGDISRDRGVSLRAVSSGLLGQSGL